MVRSVSLEIGVNSFQRHRLPWPAQAMLSVSPQFTTYKMVFGALPI